MNDPAPLLHSPGVLGLCVHTGSDICWKRLPVSCSEAQATALCPAVQAAFQSYAGGERTLTEACFAFSRFTVLVIARFTETGDAAASDFLTFLLDAPAAAPEAAAAGRTWLAENPVLIKTVSRPASPLMVRKK